MNREIKFRSWNNKYKIMLPASNTINLPNPVMDHNEYIYMQYTGFKDKDGIEIYEDDIVEYIFQELFKNKKIITLIEWDNEYTGFYPFNEKFEHWSDELTQILWDSIKIIGNKYENPKLLKLLKL
jgi:uncharacterized phage protein (TIGR01671 family)